MCVSWQYASSRRGAVAKAIAGLFGRNPIWCRVEPSPLVSTLIENSLPSSPIVGQDHATVAVFLIYCETKLRYFMLIVVYCFSNKV